jgi:ABC-type nitrate/sulfonate/bicarbonate transport system substrate-binding protein
MPSGLLCRARGGGAPVSWLCKYRATGLALACLAATLGCQARGELAAQPSAAATPPPASSAAAPSGASATPVAPEPKRVVVAVSSRSVTNVTEYVGVDYGIYAKYGFDVDVEQMQSSIVPAALISDQLDFANGLDSALRAAVVGMPIKVVAVSFRAPTFGLVVKPEITSYAELRGRVDGVAARAGAGYYAMKRLLEAHGMSIDDVQVLVVGDSPVQLQQLLQGNIDMANLAAPFVFDAQDRGFRQLAYVPDEVHLAISGLVVSDKAIQTRREEITRMTAAFVDASRFVRAHREEAVASLVTHLGVSPENAAKAYDFALPALATEPRLGLDEIRTTIQEEVDAGHVAAPPPPDQVVAFDILDEALAQLK